MCICCNLILSLVADLYIAVFNSILSNPSTGHGREGYYFGENGENNFYDLGKAVGQALVESSICKSAEPTPYTKEEIDKYFGVSIISTRPCAWKY
jgi:hypothetical protein